MQPERVEKVKSILAAALGRPPKERDAFLAHVCSGDPELRREVERYLGSADKTDKFLYHAADTIPDAHISVEELPPAPTVAEYATDPRVGKEFGKYLIRSRVAEGGMGIVYLAVDTQLGRTVALKVLPEYFSMDRERLGRFHREARATSLLNHPNIVTVFEIGQLDGCQYIVTEFVEGRTLRELMQQGQIPFVEMLKIASQVAGALAAAHRAGIIHRDIKPENVMLRPDGYVKVLDFGLAKLTDITPPPIPGSGGSNQSGVNPTTPGMIMGTVAYMSPEQAEGLETDARTDIWALGVIMYEMIGGSVPFKGPTPSHTIVAILEREPESLPNVAPELRHIIFTALQKDRALRYQTAEAMSGAIDELKHRLGYTSDKNISGPPPTARSIAAARVVSPPSPYRKLFWLIPAALVLLLLGSVGIYAVVSWLINRPAVNPVYYPATPTPEPTVDITPIPTLPEPTPTQPVIYVDPTPLETPTPAETPKKEIKIEQKEPERQVEPKRTPTPAPVRTPRPIEPKKTPVRKPTKDPNCVFTNSCN